MADAEIEQRFEEILSAIADILAPFGFVRRQRGFRRMGDDNLAVIEIQRSISNGPKLIRFTVNCGVVVGELHDAWKAPLKRARECHAQIRLRLGEFLDEPQDRWWEVDPSSDQRRTIAELKALLSDEAAPFLLEHLTNDKVCALWASGRAPGISDGQRLRYLAELNAGLGYASP